MDALRLLQDIRLHVLQGGTSGGYASRQGRAKRSSVYSMPDTGIRETARRVGLAVSTVSAVHTARRQGETESVPERIAVDPSTKAKSSGGRSTADQTRIATMRYAAVNPYPHEAVLRIDPADLRKLEQLALDDDTFKIVTTDKSTPDWWNVTVACASQRVRERLRDAFE